MFDAGVALKVVLLVLAAWPSTVPITLETFLKVGKEMNVLLMKPE